MIHKNAFIPHASSRGPHGQLYLHGHLKPCDCCCREVLLVFGGTGEQLRCAPILTSHWSYDSKPAARLEKGD